MADINKRVDDALVRAFGDERLPDVVDMAVGQRVFDAIAAHQGRPVWWAKWAPPRGRSLPPRSEPVTIYLHLTDEDPDECEVIRGR